MASQPLKGREALPLLDLARLKCSRRLVVDVLLTPRRRLLQLIQFRVLNFPFSSHPLLPSHPPSHLPSHLPFTHLILTSLQSSLVPSVTMDDMELSFDLVFEQPEENESENEPESGRLTPIRHLIPVGFTRLVRGIYRSGFPDVLHLDIYEELRMKSIW